VVADLIQAPVEYAAMIDAALGPAAQYLVVTGDEFIASFVAGDVELSGRIALTPGGTGILPVSSRGDEVTSKLPNSQISNL
jgi:hypothetical protein